LLGPPVLLGSDVGQAVGAGDRLDNDASAIAAVPSVRPAARNVLLTAEAAAARPSVASLDVDNNTADKHGGDTGRFNSLPMRAPHGGGIRLIIGSEGRLLPDEPVTGFNRRCAGPRRAARSSTGCADRAKGSSA